MCRSRTSSYSVPPAHPGSVGSGAAGAPGVLASDQRVGTSARPTRASASSTARSNVVSPPSGSGMYSAIAWSRQTTSFTNDSMSGTAMARGTGVTRFTHCADSHGLSTGTGITSLRRRPATAA